MSNMLQTKTAEEILTTVFKPKEFIIDGLLTQGLYVLAGAQKVGKSWLAMDICVSALQQEFLYSDVILFRELLCIFVSRITISDYSADCLR